MNIVIDNIHYHVETYGKGFPLVLLHGFTGDTSTWTPFRESWGKHSQLIMLDIIGHGKTESPEEINRYGIESAAHDLKKILDQMNIDRVDLLGYSMGGRLALTFTLLFPERIRKMILESASPGIETAEERESRRIKDKELAQFITENGIKAFVDYWEEIPLFTTMKHLPILTREKIRSQRLKNTPSGLANSLLGMGTGSQPSRWGELCKIQCEVLLLTGKEDKKFCVIAEKMLSKLKNGSWIVFEGSGHAIHVEVQEKFGTIVSDFLN